MGSVEQMPFTYQSYAKMIRALREKNFAFVNYSNYRDQKGKAVILRHDVDFDPMRCYRMAEIEYLEKASSTFFFLLRSDFYNVLSPQTLPLVKELEEMGHSVGLHFDETAYCGDVDLVKAIQDEAAILGDMLGHSVSCVSMHRPSVKCLEGDWQIAGMENSYSHELRTEYEYVSDSRRRWKKPIMNMIESCLPDVPQKLHILTHPFWYHEKENTIEEDLSSFVDSAKHERLFALYNNVSNLDENVSRQDISRAVIWELGRRRFLLERVVLRPVRMSDAVDMFEYASDPAVCQFLQWGPYTALSEAEQWLESKIENSKREDVLFGVELKEESRLIGVVRIYSFDFEKRQGEVSYILNPAYSGKGLATEAVKGAIEVVCNALGLRSIVATVDFENEESSRLAQRLGFRYLSGEDFQVEVKNAMRLYKTFEYESGIR